ncbi:MAG: twin-arginine translocation signal domain-containing protein [Acidobacteria bacterium]|nr:MAG: twin-arginine translocation signal domain-containing protein [Acidobacteriota bacterium]
MSTDRRGFLQRSGMAAAGIGAGMAAVPRAAAAAVQDSTARQVQHVGGHQGGEHPRRVQSVLLRRARVAGERG